MSTNVILFDPVSKEHSYESHSEARFHYSKQEWEMRLQFVSEYVKDYDPVIAVMRLGYIKDVALAYSKAFLAEPAVQKLIDEHKCPKWLAEGKTTAEKQILATLWREANFFGFGGSPQARIAATKGLATLMKMDPAHKEIKVPHLFDHEALSLLPLEEQQSFVATLKKLAKVPA